MLDAAVGFLDYRIPNSLPTQDYFDTDIGNQHIHGCESQKGLLWLSGRILSIPVTSVMKLPSCQQRRVGSGAVKMDPPDERKNPFRGSRTALNPTQSKQTHD